MRSTDIHGRYPRATAVETATKALSAPQPRLLAPNWTACRCYDDTAGMARRALKRRGARARVLPGEETAQGRRRSGGSDGAPRFPRDRIWSKSCLTGLPGSLHPRHPILPDLSARCRLLPAQSPSAVDANPVAGSDSRVCLGGTAIERTEEECPVSWPLGSGRHGPDFCWGERRCLARRRRGRRSRRGEAATAAGTSWPRVSHRAGDGELTRRQIARPCKARKVKCGEEHPSCLK